MADRKPCDLVKIFTDENMSKLEYKINDWLEKNPDFYIDKMQFFVHDGASLIRKYVVCDFCLREDIEESAKDALLTEELLKGLIGAVNELTDTVKELTNKK